MLASQPNKTPPRPTQFIQPSLTDNPGDRYNMLRLLVINAHHAYPFSPGKLNQSLASRAIEYAQSLGHEVKTTETGTLEWDVDEEIAKHQWADIVLVQSPVNWMGHPWSFKKYQDEVYTAGMDGRLCTGDGRHSDAPKEHYGEGGSLEGTKYALSLTFNAPSESFGNVDEYLFGSKTVDDLFFPTHCNFRFFGMSPLPTFAAYDVMKNPEIDAILADFDTYLVSLFAPPSPQSESPGGKDDVVDLKKTNEALQAATSSSLATFVSMEEAGGDDGQDIVCFAAATMNGWKIPIAMEVLGEPYDVVFVDFARNMQKTPEYLEINPNGRIPAIRDRQANLTLAESGACLQYLADKYPGRLAPDRAVDPDAYWAVIQWVYWQVSGLGPAMGNSMYLQRIAAPSGISAPFATKRFVDESARCLGVINDQIERSGGPFMMGQSLTLADIACYPYARSHFWAVVDVSPFSHLRDWLDTLDDHPAFAAGLTVPHERREFFGEGDVERAISANAGQFISTPNAPTQP